MTRWPAGKDRTFAELLRTGSRDGTQHRLRHCFHWRGLRPGLPGLPPTRPELAQQLPATGQLVCRRQPADIDAEIASTGLIWSAPTVDLCSGQHSRSPQDLVGADSSAKAVFQARKISPVSTSSRTSPLLHRPCLLRASAVSERRAPSFISNRAGRPYNAGPD